MKEKSIMFRKSCIPILIICLFSACSQTPPQGTNAHVTNTGIASTPATAPVTFPSVIPATSPAATPVFPATLPASNGKSYYVSPDGNDGQAGSLEHPWRTIQYAVDNLSPGDTVYIRAGVYRERVVLNRSGSSAGMLTVSAFPGEAATLDGQGIDLWNWGGIIELSGQHDVRITGLRIVNSSYAGVFAEGGYNLVVDHLYTYNTASSGIAFFGAHDVLVDSNEVVWAGTGGQQEYITLTDTQNFEVRYNHVHDFNPNTGGKEGIDAKDGSANGVIHHNHVHNLDRVGIYVDAYSKHSYNIQVYANQVHDINADGFSIAGEAGGLLENISFFNNISYHNMNHGFSISNCCEDLAVNHPMQNILIINNTFADNGWDWGGGIRVANPDASGVIIRNNTLSQNVSFQLLIESWAQAAELIADHNLIDGYRNRDGEFYGNEYMAGDPLFFDVGLGDFRIRPQSPVVDAGASADSPAVDIAGNLRPTDGNQDGIADVDIGAYEFMP